MFRTLIKGFNLISVNWYLMLFPILMDVLLWLGPKLKVKTLLSPLLSYMSANLLKLGTTDMINTLSAYQKMWEQMVDQFNLSTVLRTFPVGIPSLIAREFTIDSPLGKGLVYEIPNVNIAFAIILVLLLVGFFLGSFYFILVSRVTAPEKEKVEFKDVLSSYLQSLVMFCLVIILLVLILLPLSMLLSVLSLISAGLGQFFFIMAVFILLWLLIPLVFAPHGVFVLKQKALPSMLISIRLVRQFLPGTGLFVFLTIVISEGLNMLWSLPDPHSWMTLVGIGGHGFVITGLLAASFVYYRDGLKWMQDNLQRIADSIKMQQNNGGTTLEQ